MTSDSRDRIHLRRLVRLASSSLPLPTPPLDPYALLKLRATLTHARELLDEAVRLEGDSEPWASTSRHGAKPPRDSLLDLDERLTRAEKEVERLSGAGGGTGNEAFAPFSSPSRRPLSAASSSASSSLLSGSFTNDGFADDFQEDDSDLSFLPLPVPVAPPAPFFSSSPSSAPSSSAPLPDAKAGSPPTSPSLPPAAREFRAASASASAPLPRSTSAASLSSAPSRPATPSTPTTTAAVGAGAASEFGEFGLRQRPAHQAGVVPPYLAARRAAKQKQAEGEAASQEKEEKGKGRAAVEKAADDLLPASSSSATQSGDLLSHHHALQSTLLSDLTSLSSALKSNTVAFSSNLAKDREVMERAKQGLEGNEGKMREGQKRLEGVRKKGRGTTCWTVGAVVVVVVMWVATFGLMRISRA
ncbi:hypothetical protein JCM6882_004536 [Rhodosporidiobolus microsporus]